HHDQRRRQIPRRLVQQFADNAEQGSEAHGSGRGGHATATIRQAAGMATKAFDRLCSVEVRSRYRHARILPERADCCKARGWISRYISGHAPESAAGPAKKCARAAARK
ncbi:MAG: hypothetical protein ABTS22_09855, partial [Accumulibacter sp.]|uniref:hypothetical protein n=1 Tax=Accumulibacter sp. TaxID=2053492 RepID=UPI00331602C6